MKLSVWDFLTILLLLGTLGVIVVVAQIFTDPNSGINPFPPPTLPSRLVLPTHTNTPLRLPATWTPGGNGKVTPVPTDLTPSGLRATWTLLPSSTGFVVDTWTPTATDTATPTNTRTPSPTPTINLTATYQAVGTQVAGTANAKATLTANAATKTYTPTVQPTSTYTFTPTYTTAPTSTYTATATATTSGYPYP